MKPRAEQANKYIKRIKNEGKREYAAKYWGYLMFGDPEPVRSCSAMAAQAVRWELLELQKEIKANPDDYKIEYIKQ